MRRDPLHYLQSLIDERDPEDASRPIPVLDGPQAARTTINGRSVVNLASNNYLGLTTHPRLRARAIEALDRWGVGAGAVRRIAGTTALHVELEQRLAAFAGTEAALVFQTGYAANVSALSAILGRDDLVVSDELNHPSVVDGARLARATFKVYPHRQIDAARRLLSARSRAARPLLVTDGVFSMDGDLALLPDLCNIAEESGAIMMVDDAHGTGVFGRSGRGSVDHWGVGGRVDIQVGTLSKAVGAIGGYVAGTRSLIEFLARRARPFLFSTPLPPVVVAASLAALELLVEEPELIERLWDNTRLFKAGLAGLGYNTGLSEGPITPVIVGSSQLAAMLSDRLFAGGVFAPPVSFPLVPKGLARVRTIVTASHSAADLEHALQVFRSAGTGMGIITP